jgi:predicted phage terminase large subunit-like protein
MTPEERSYYTLAVKHFDPPYKGSEEEWLSERNKDFSNLFEFAKNRLRLDLVDNFYCNEHVSVMSREPGVCPYCSLDLKPYAVIPNENGEYVSIHREICDIFIQKDPSKPIHDQDKKKIRLILCPRSTFKSSIDAADAAQWIIGFPDVRIVVFSASPELGKDFVRVIKDWFTVTQDKDKGDNAPFVCNERYVEFQHLHPECLVPASESGAADRYMNPNRKNKSLVDPTLRTLPLLGNTSGHHFDVGKFDDCISDVNCGPNSSVDERAKVGENLITKRKLILLSGFKDYVGTPYATDDYYSQAAETLKSGKSRIFDKVLIRSAWKMKPGVSYKQLEELEESDVDLLFPIDSKGEPHLTFDALKKEALDNFYIFSCQYLCSPQLSRAATFTEQMIQTHTVSTENLPQSGEFEAYSAWDLASSTERYSDYSVGVVGYFCTAGPLCGRLFVMDIRLGKWSPSELAFQIADQAARWRAKGIGIEKSPGAENLESSIMIELNRQGYYDAPRVTWFSVSVQKDAKNFRAESLETMFHQDRLWFSNTIPIMEEVTKQFVGFKPHSKRKDDAVDAIAYLTRFQPNVTVPKNEQERRQALYDFIRQKDQYERIFEHPPAPAIEEKPFETPKTYDGMPVWANAEEQYYGGS